MVKTATRRALEWLEKNDPASAEELLVALQEADEDAILELVAGVPDRVTGRTPVGGDFVDEGRFDATDR